MQGFPVLPFLQAVQDLQSSLPRSSAWMPSESLMQDLAGNAMSLPVVLAMLQCGFSALTWSSCAASKAAGEAPLSKDEGKVGAPDCVLPSLPQSLCYSARLFEIWIIDF